MNWKSTINLWSPFVVVSALTLSVYMTLWESKWYWVALSMLGLLSMMLGARILASTGLRRLPVAGVFIGLFLGQWWFVEAAGMQIIWRVNGIAP